MRFSGHVERESRVLSYRVRNPFARKPKKFKFAVKGANEELPKVSLIVSLIAQLVD